MLWNGPRRIRGRSGANLARSARPARLNRSAWSKTGRRVDEKQRRHLPFSLCLR